MQYSTCSTCYRLDLEKLGVKIEGANNLNFLLRDVRFEWVQNWRANSTTKTGIVFLLHVNLEQKPELWNSTHQFCDIKNFTEKITQKLAKFAKITIEQEKFFNFFFVE